MEGAEDDRIVFRPSGESWKIDEADFRDPAEAMATRMIKLPPIQAD
jgi:hypothetical protein